MEKQLYSQAEIDAIVNSAVADQPTEPGTGNGYWVFRDGKWVWIEEIGGGDDTVGTD